MADMKTTPPQPPEPAQSLGEVCCATCEYSLRSLSPSSVCPECGTPVERTLLFALQFDPVWVRRLQIGVAFLIPAAFVLLCECVALVLFGDYDGRRGLLPWQIAHRAGIPVVNIRNLSHPGIPSVAAITLPLLALAGIGMLVLSTPPPPWERVAQRSARGARCALMLIGTISMIGAALLVTLPFLASEPPIQSAALLGVLACDALLLVGFWLAVDVLRVRSRAAGLNWQAATFSAALRALLYLPAGLAVIWIFLLLHRYATSMYEFLKYLRLAPVVLVIVHAAVLVALVGLVASLDDAARQRREALAGLVPPASLRFGKRGMRIQRMAQALLVILTIASIAIARQTWERQQGPRPVAEDDSGPIMYAAFAPATDRVALTTKSTYEDVALFDTTRWNRIGSVARTKGYLRTLTFSPDGSTLAGSDDQFLFIWDAVTGAVRARISTPPGTGGAMAVALSPQGRWVAVAYWSALYGAVNAQGVHRFDLSTTPPTELPPLSQLPGPFSPITCLEFSPDGKWLFSGENLGRVCAWDLTNNWRPARSFDAHFAPIVAIAPAPDGNSVFIAANVLYHYNFATNHLIGTVPFDRSAPCTTIAVSADGQRVLTVDGAIRVRNIADGSVIATFRRQTQAYRAAFSADGKRVFTADLDGHLRAWELPPPASP
jgi:hypothetical protein